MIVRTLLTLVNCVVFAVTIAILLEFPAYVEPTFYFLLAWMVVSFTLFYLPFASRRIGGGSGPAANPGSNPFEPAGALPETAPPPAPSPLGFCIYCATPLPGGATVCPACGHTVPRI